MNDILVTLGKHHSFRIPAALLESLGWTPGTWIAFILQPDGTALAATTLTPRPGRPVSKGREKRPH